MFLTRSVASVVSVLVVGLSGDVPERTCCASRDGQERDRAGARRALGRVARRARRGGRDHHRPDLIKSYGLSIDRSARSRTSFNTLIAAGALEGQSGRFAVKVPSLFEKPQDMLKVPVIASPNATVTLSDIAQIKPTFKDATSVTRVNGRPAMTIEVSKRTGANLIETVDAVKYIVGELQKTWPEAVHVTFTQDKSKVIRQMLGDLQNSVATGVLLVAVMILFALGFRASLFIGIAIPASFLAGVLGLQLAGLTVNIVVLFSLILAVGMLVDDAIIVSEFAERRMAEGMPPREAYSLAAKRMSGPVIAATATRVAAFSPLLFWPGVVGQFMKYLPITLIATLSASLAVALFFTPTLGCAARQGRAGAARRGRLRGRALHAHGAAGAAPSRHDAGARGVPAVRGADRLRQVRPRRRVLPRASSPITARCIVHAPRQSLARREEPPGRRGRAARARRSTASRPSIPASASSRAGMRRTDRGHDRRHPVRVRRLAPAPACARDHGRDPRQDRRHSRHPGRGDGAARRPADRQADPGAARRGRSRRCCRAWPRRSPAILAARSDIRDLDDGQPLPGIDWKIEVDKAEAAKYGAGVGTVGSAVQLVTNGLKATEYRPVDSDKAVDILVRFPPDRRSLDQIDELRMQTPVGHVPIGNFVQRVPAQRVGYINRVNANRVMTVSANVAEGVQTANVQQEIAQELVQDRSRPRRDLQAQGRGRGAREGGRVPDEGVRHRDLPDLRDPAGAVQPAHLGRAGADRGGAVDLRRAARPA